MNSATAAATASVSISYEQTPSMFPTATNALVERYGRLFTLAAPRPSDSKPESSIFRASVLQPAWLEDVQRAVASSVVRQSSDTPGDGRWLSQEVANAAADFLSTTADILPERPFIYSSRQGALVAEFAASRSNLTAVISSTSVSLFAVVNGVPVEHSVTKAAELRDAVRRVVEPLLSEQNGDLATQV